MLVNTRSHKEIIKAVVNCKVCMRLIRAHLAAEGGKTTSVAKANAARINGKLGGRPRKSNVSR